MQRISITNPQNIIDGTAKKYYFKLRNTGGPKGDKGDKGDTGATGPQGPQGNAATVSVGSTTTLPVGYDATVTNSGSIYNAVLDFGIPQGPQGPQGAKGDKGDTGAQGKTGPRGPQGERGTNATVYVGTTTTTNPGTQARVYNSGTDSNAVLNFEIPRGDVGPMPTIAQTTGQSTTEVMSQKATTDALNTKQATISSSNKLSADLVTDTSTTNKFVTASDKTTWNAKQNALTAGDNITISGDTISATDTTYTAGNGLNLNGTEFSANTDVLATKEDLEGYYTKPETDNLLAPKLEAEVVAELPTTGAEGKLYLTPKAHTTQTATGNPITATVAEEAGAIESFQLDGDTFQQTYTGKNLFNVEAIPYVAKRAYGRDGAVQNWSDYTGTDEYQPVEPSTEYTLWNNKTGNTTYLCEYDENKNFIQRLVAVRTFTTTATTRYLRWSLKVGTGEVPPTQTQLELGSAETSYEPYVGGQPSPNPSYPQDINVVTGTQTISINGTNYPLDLGDIQLCGLGDDGNGNPLYKDYIYPDGEDWKIHKATAKTICDGDQEIWMSYSSGQNTVFYQEISDTAYGSASSNPILADKFKSAFSAENGNTFLSGSTHRVNFCTNVASGVQGWITWLASNPITVYYATYTATDTVITDTALIAQLEAVRTAMLQNGANTITNTATGTNLAGDMEIGYYGYNPTNRYDKFIWLDLNNAYEQLNNPDTSSTLSTRSLGTTTEQPTVTRSLETETITLKKVEAEPIEDKTELPTILDEEAEETETTEPEESDGTDER